jgi:hypothetical protein
MRIEPSKGAAPIAPATAVRTPLGRRLRATAVLLLAFTVATGLFAAAAELVLHRWLHLFATSITGAAWAFFGGYWTLASHRQLQGLPPISVKPRRWPLAQVATVYLSTWPGVAGRSFLAVALLGVVERLWRA